MTKWVVIPMLIDSQRPEYCPCTNEEDYPECPSCPATVAGNDIVGGVCQAFRNRPKLNPLVELTLVMK